MEDLPDAVLGLLDDGNELIVPGVAYRLHVFCVHIVNAASRFAYGAKVDGILFCREQHLHNTGCHESLQRLQPCVHLQLIVFLSAQRHGDFSVFCGCKLRT